MEKEILKRFLLKGDNIFFKGKRNKKAIEIINLKLGEIYSQAKFYKYLLLVKYFSIKSEINEMEDFLFKREILKEFIVCDNVDYQYNFNEFVIFYNDELISLGDEDVQEIMDILMEMYQIREEKKEEIKGRQKAMELYDELMNFKKECDKKNAVTLDSIIEAITVKHNSYNLLNIWELTIYQLFETYKRILIVDNYNEVNHWKYSGFMDIKKINEDEINWAKNIT